MAGFWMAPRDLARLLTTRALTPAQFTLLVFLGVSGADRKDGLATTNSSLAQSVGISDRTLRRALAELRAQGFVTYDDHERVPGFTVRLCGRPAVIEGVVNDRSVTAATADTAATATDRDPARQAGAPAVTTSDLSRARAETDTDTRDNELLRSSRTPSNEIEIEIVEDRKGTPAQALVGFYVDLCRGLDVEPPARVKGQIAKQTGELLREGYPVEVIGRALALLVDRRLHPSALPSLVLEAKAGSGRRANEHPADALARRIRERKR